MNINVISGPLLCSLQLYYCVKYILSCSGSTLALSAAILYLPTSTQGSGVWPAIYRDTDQATLFLQCTPEYLPKMHEAE